MTEEMTLEEYNEILVNPAPRGNKFHAKRTVASDGQMCDSRAEMRRYEQLLLMQRSGEISDLVIHPRWLIQVNGRDICHYTADAQYIDHGILIVEDTKSPPTRKKRDYRIVKKLMEAVFGIQIKEVML